MRISSRASSTPWPASKPTSRAATEMACLRAFGCYLPERIVDNAEIGAAVGADPAWILQATGIEQRRFAAAEETVVSMGVRAAHECPLHDVGLILVSSGSAERRFPGP